MINYFLGIVFLISYLFNINPYSANIEKKSYDYEGLKYDIYGPGDNASTGKVLLLVHGLTKDGNKDSELVKMSEIIARNRIIVMVPDFEGIKGSQLGYDEVEDVKKAIEIMARLFTGKRKGVMSFCYSNGIVSSAVASSENIRIDYLISWGSYASLRDQLRYNITGYYKKNNEMMYAKTSEEVRRCYYNQKYWYADIPREEALKIKSALVSGEAGSFSASGDVVYKLLSNRKLADFDVLYDNLPEKTREWIRFMSPENYVDKLKCKTIFIHSYFDSLIPYDETIKLYDKCGSTHKKLFVPYLFEHYEKIELKAFINAGVLKMAGGLMTYYLFVTSLLSA